MLAPVYIFYGFESAGDIAEETKDAGRQIPRAMRLALIWGGIASFVLTAALLLAMPKVDPVGATVKGGGVPFLLGQLSSGVQDFLLLLIIFAFFSCGTSIQGAGSRLAFSFARDGALPKSAWIATVNKRFRTPVNALLVGAAITVLFVLLVYYSPSHNIHIWFITYPANVNALVTLVSFGVSGIYLSFLLTVIGSIVARRRGWVPEGASGSDAGVGACRSAPRSTLGSCSSTSSRRRGSRAHVAYFNLDWITLFVIFIIAVVGAAYYFVARPDRTLAGHVHDPLEASGAERH